MRLQNLTREVLQIPIYRTVDVFGTGDPARDIPPDKVKEIEKLYVLGDSADEAIPNELRDDKLAPNPVLDIPADDWERIDAQCMFYIQNMIKAERYRLL